MKLGEKQVLTVVKKVDFGVYLGSEKERVLLPKKQAPQGVEAGDPVEVFLYKDSSDRLIATTNEPKLTMGHLAVLEVADVGRVGAFLDWGLEKDLLLPFREQTVKVSKKDRCLVGLYIDKSGRLCATMKIYPMLRTDSPYRKDDMVKGTVYGISREFGVFVAVDNRYSALIPKKDVYGKLNIGQEIEARVTSVKADGKLDLSIRSKIPEQMDEDARKIMERIRKGGGMIPFTDKADPELIREEFGMSKAAFKRAVGKLLKERKIKIDEAQGKILQFDANRV
nr:S1-like domain-containing RNA-binding protein [uncultured Mediterraneibacter sp.]